MTKTMDLRTAKERERDAKHASIINKYCTLASEAGNVAPTRLIAVVAAEFGMTSMGVRNILIKNNIITTKSQQQ